MQKIVNKLKELNKTISTMESCTGGGVVNAITNIPGASDILKFSAVTYSNEYKIKMGVNKDTIEKYSVYSMEVAKEMSKAISDFTTSDYGVGVTGRINVIDKANLGGNTSIIYVSIYNRELDKYYTMTIDAINASRLENKKLIINSIERLLNTIL